MGGVGPASGLGGYHAPAQHTHPPRLAEYSHSARQHKPNAMSGRNGLEGNSAAYDMKSLDKHLEATPISSDEYALSDREELETTLIRSLIASYLNIVRLSIQDLVPKAIMHLLVNFSRESVQNRLVASLYKENLFGELLYEDEGLTSERKRVKQLLDAYREAFNTLSEVTLKPSAGVSS